MEAERKQDCTVDPYRRQRLLVLLTALVLLIGALHAANIFRRESYSVFHPQSRPCLVLDPGHGGIDGGAIAYDGTKESDLNLAIALKLRDLASFYGCDTEMTRSDDSRRTDFMGYSEHEDLVFRVNLINQVPNGVLFSIHQNYYPSSQPRGAQVLYAAGEESKRLGELTHSLLLRSLQPENRRVAQPAGKELYITAHAVCPAVLVECGFLSNFDDLQQLRSDLYQTKLAAVLLTAFLQYTEQIA